MSNKLSWIGLLIMLYSLVACSQSSDLPTRLPKAIVPEQVSVVTRAIPPTSAPTEPPLTPTPSLTPVVPTGEPTSVAGSGVNITSPNEGTQFLQGQEAVAGGLVQLKPSESLSVYLVAPTGHLISEADVQINEFNSWQANLIVPYTTSGPAEFQAFLTDDAEKVLATDVQPVQLLVNKEGSDRQLELFRPIQGQETVAGFNLFFDGVTQLPVDNLITISIWSESCQVEVAKQSFRLRGSGYWQGFVVVPWDVTGPVCAVAHFGNPGEETRREAQVQLNVLAADDPAAVAVQIGNPPPNSLLTPGKPLLLYGTAYNAPENSVMVSILLENGRLLTEGQAGVNDYGYWELELFIPEEVEGLALIEATVGARDSDEFAVHEVVVNVGSVQ